MSLFTAESRRLSKRRFIRWSAVAGLLVLVAIAVGMYLSHEQKNPASVAAAEARAEANYRENVQWTEQHRRECEAAKGTARAADFGDCESIQPSARTDYQAEWYMPPEFVFTDQFGRTWLPFAAIMALIAFIAGASFVGAEWASGGMMNLLLWRPRRLQVLGTKLLALLTWVTALSVVVAGLWTAAFWFIAALRGSNAGMTSGAWQSQGLTGLRALGLILAAAMLGFGLASLGRHTAMALGAAVGVAVVIQFGVAIVIELARVDWPQLWLLPTYGLAWMNKSYEVTNEQACANSGTGACEPLTMEITWQMSGGLLTGVVVLVLLFAFWSMRRRDIT